MENVDNVVIDNSSTAQEVFDTSYLRVVKQEEPSIDNLGYCKYYKKSHEDKILKCGVGILMNDKEAKSLECTFRGKPIGTILGCYSPKVQPWMITHRFLLKGIQKAHDNSTIVGDFITNFMRRMAEVALDHNLTIPRI